MEVKELEAAYRRILCPDRIWNCVEIENAQNHYLWCSINPSDGEGIPTFNMNWNELASDGYWRKLKEKIKNHLNEFGHIDLFPIHCSAQREFLKKYRGKEGSTEFIRFVELLKVTQLFIEDLQPKLIVYSNVSTRHLWGWPKKDWMGYILKPVSLPFSVDSGRISRHPKDSLFKITGINNSSLVIKEEKSTQLVDTYILFDNQNNNHFGHPEISDKDLDRIIAFVNKK